MHVQDLELDDEFMLLNGITSNSRCIITIHYIHVKFYKRKSGKVLPMQTPDNYITYVSSS